MVPRIDLLIESSTLYGGSVMTVYLREIFSFNTPKIMFLKKLYLAEDTGRTYLLQYSNEKPSIFSMHEMYKTEHINILGHQIFKNFLM